MFNIVFEYRFLYGIALIYAYVKRRVEYWLCDDAHCELLVAMCCEHCASNELLVIM